MDIMDSIATTKYICMGHQPQQGSLSPSIYTFDNRRSPVYYQTAHVEPTQSLNISTAQRFSSTEYLNNMNSGMVPSIFLSARQTFDIRYTPKDWHNAQMTNYFASDKIRAASERLRSDTIVLAREKDKQAFKNNVESSKRLAKNINDIEYWENELKKNNDKMKHKINDIELKQREIERLLSGTEKPLHTAQKNLYEREKRQGIDLVHDNVEQELIREVKTIELSQQKLRQMLKRLNSQNALNLVSLHELEHDAEDKFHAHVLDSTALNIKTTSWDINFYESIENVDNTVSVPESWARYTQENIRRSLNQIGQSDELLNASNQLVATIYNDIWSQWNHVNISLENRLQEEQLAKNKIQAHLEKILQEISDVEQTIEYLKKTIADQEVFLQVAQTRLETRSRRPNIEACRDSAMHRLIQEVDDLHAAIDELHSKLCQEENAVQLLLRTKSILEQDLIIKNNSLFIDSEKVMSIRRKFMMDASEKSFVTSIPFSQPHDLITV